MNYPTLEQHLTLWLDPDLAATAAASWEQDMTVKTRDQLDALPPGSVVRDRHGCILELDPTASRAFWIETGGEVGPPALPARILSLPKPVPGTTTPETPAEPPETHTDGTTPPEKPTVTITLNAAASEKLVAGLLDAPAPGVGGEECAHCGTLWPCETGRILERIDL